MGKIDNLLKGNEKHTFTPEEASKGGKKSVEVRRKKKELRECFEILLEKEYADKKGRTQTGAELIAFKQFQKAMDGDTRAFEVIRDTAGQKPVEKVMVAEVDNDVISEIENMVLNDD
jgi:hypothetical protein